MSNENFFTEAQGAYTPYSSLGLPQYAQVANGKLDHFYVPPSSSLSSWAGSGNACGVTAFATILKYFGKFNVADPHAQIKAYWENGNTGPDIAGGALGMSWQRLQSNFRMLGLKTVAGNEDRATVWMGDGKWDWLKGWVNNGYPVAVTVANKPISGDDGGHWTIVRQIIGNDVHLENMGYSEEIVAKDTFINAWEAHREGGLPWTHYASVVAYL
jgi:hypothetical protein